MTYRWYLAECDEIEVREEVGMGWVGMCVAGSTIRLLKDWQRGFEFAGKIANPRDVLVFHRAKKSAARRVVADEPEFDGDEEGNGLEKLAAGQVRVHSLVQEYLRAQEMQLLGEAGMSDAIQVFVEKDDPHAISKYVFSVRFSWAIRD